MASSRHLTIRLGAAWMTVSGRLDGRGRFGATLEAGPWPRVAWAAGRDARGWFYGAF